MDRILSYCDLELIDYNEAWDLQKSIFDLRYRNGIKDILLLLEHPHTYTLGKTANKKNLIGSKKFLEENKISVYDIDRGGDITYHGPGQIVGYPIIDLNKWEKDSHKYLRALEEVLIKTCSEYGLRAGRNKKYTGVWIGERKIAAIGIKISRWITMHGFAFNVNTQLNYYNGIIPCGISDKSVTSLEEEIGSHATISEVKEKIVRNFQKVFSYCSVTTLRPSELNAFQAEVNV